MELLNSSIKDGGLMLGWPFFLLIKFVYLIGKEWETAVPRYLVTRNETSAA
jgi:hypothetical protein